MTAISIDIDATDIMGDKELTSPPDAIATRQHAEPRYFLDSRGVRYIAWHRRVMARWYREGIEHAMWWWEDTQ